MSDADILLFMTQDAIPADTHLLEQFQKIFQNAKETGIAAAYARQLPREDASLTECITREFNYPDCDRIQNITTFEKYGIGRAVWNYKQKDFGIVDPHYEEILDEVVKNL